MRPMLAATADEELIKFHLTETPLLASPKLDGIRGLILNGQLVSRSLKPIRNKYVQSILGIGKAEGLDGELICGSPTAPDCYRKSNSAFMSADGEPTFTYHVFDLWNVGTYFIHRHQALSEPYRMQPFCSSIAIVPHRFLSTIEEVLKYEEKCIKEGYEGIILRRPDRPYKFNRSTKLEGGMLKLKRFLDGEARIVGMDELLRNENPAQVSELGLTMHSSHKEHQRPAGTMGALVVEELKTGQRFKIGTGFDAVTRQDFWDKKQDFIGTIVKYKSLPIGVKDLPRHPVYLGLRLFDDMGE